eukprot:2438297-Prymnesium_polylepis.1
MALGYTRLCDGARFNFYKGFVAVRTPLRTPGRTGYATQTDWNRSPDPACRPPHSRTCHSKPTRELIVVLLSMRATRM